MEIEDVKTLLFHFVNGDTLHITKMLLECIIANSVSNVQNCTNCCEELMPSNEETTCQLPIISKKGMYVTCWSCYILTNQYLDKKKKKWRRKMLKQKGLKRFGKYFCK